MFQKVQPTIFGKQLSAAGIGKTVQASIVVDKAQSALREIYGEHMNQAARCVAVRYGRLRIAVPHPIVAQLICEQQQQWMKKINETCYPMQVTDLQFVYLDNQDTDG